MLDTNKLLTNQYLGRESSVNQTQKSKAQAQEPNMAGKHDSHMFFKNKEQKEHIAEKVGQRTENAAAESETAKKEAQKRKKGSSVTPKPQSSSYASKIKQAVSDLKQESFTTEFLDYSKYNRFKHKAEPKVPEETHEFRVLNTGPKMDDVDMRRILVDLKVPFNFKAQHKDEVSGMLKEGKLSLWVKGKSGTITDWKAKMKERGIELEAANHSHPLTTKFTDEKIKMTSNADQFLDRRGEPGKVSSAIKDRKKEILEECIKRQTEQADL